jgi:hypothetical protein
MKKIFYLFAALCAGRQASAQVPEDALRMSWNPQSGTARSQAIGGAMGSLGGDISSMFVNPAGLGFYKTGEFVVSPGFSFLNEKSNYLGAKSNAGSSTKFNLGTSGIVWSQPNYRNPMWKNTTGSFAINRVADFNGRTYYKGENNYSSFSEMYAEEFARSGVSFNDPLYSAPLTFATKLATYTYLIDTLTTSNGTEVVGLPERDAILNNTTAKLLQENDIQTKGGITELAFGYASNYNDKVYIGGSIGVPIVNYRRTSIITETDLSGSSTNNFKYAKYQEDYKSTGVGVNARIGVIIKASPNFRAGLSINTPTIYGLTERTTGTMENDLEGYAGSGIISANADSIYTQYGADIPQYKYDLITPWKFLVSGSYIFSGVEDVTKQKGFITADVEYVTYGTSRFHSANDEDDANYYNSVNDAVKLSYKSAFNFRVGGELKFNPFMARLGFAYYGNPYDDPALKAHKMNVSGGLGYRGGGIFVDLTYVQSLNRDVNFPYRLSDKANSFADVRNNNGNVMLTFGVKF